MKRYPGRIRCYCFADPGYVREAREEISRCVEKLGFIAVRLYNDYVATEPVVRPLVEQCIRLRILILHHAGHAYWLPSSQPRISDGGTFAELTERVSGHQRQRAGRRHRRDGGFARPTRTMPTGL